MSSSTENLLAKINILDFKSFFDPRLIRYGQEFCMTILGVLTDLQTDFFNEHQPSPTFGELILVEQAKGFNLRYMATMRSLELKRYYVITKKL